MLLIIIFNIIKIINVQLNFYQVWTKSTLMVGITDTYYINNIREIIFKFNSGK